MQLGEPQPGFSGRSVISVE